MLNFQPNIDGLQNLVNDLAATERQVKVSLYRSLSRTATSLRVLAARKMHSDLELRTIMMLRKRMKSLSIKVGDGQGFRLWFGLNDIPVSWFKGTPSGGASGATHKGTAFPGAFVAKSKFKGRKTVFKRNKGAARLHISEQLKTIEKKSAAIIENKIFGQTEKIFWQHFERDLRARVAYKLGK